MWFVIMTIYLYNILLIFLHQNEIILCGILLQFKKSKYVYYWHSSIEGTDNGKSTWQLFGRCHYYSQLKSLNNQYNWIIFSEYNVITGVTFISLIVVEFFHMIKIFFFRINIETHNISTCILLMYEYFLIFMYKIYELLNKKIIIFMIQS